MSPTKTKGQPMPTATKTRPVLDRLEEVRANAKKRKRIPYDITDERVAAQARIEEARQDLRVYFASGKTDEKIELKLREAIVRKEREHESQPWGERIEGAQMVARTADQDVQRFIAENFDDLAHEHREKCAALCDELVQSIERASELHGALRKAFTEWRPLLQQGAPGEFGSEANGVDQSISRNDERLTRGFLAIRRGLEGWAPMVPIDRLLERISEEGLGDD